VISTGEGGMVLTDSAEYAAKLRLLRQHGMSVPDTVRHEARKLIIEQYLCVGFNYRMSDLQAAVGVAQMDRLDELVRRRRELAARYNDAFADMPGLLPPFVPDYAEPNYQSYIVQLTPEAPRSRNALIEALLARGIAAKPGVMAIHREPAYRDRTAAPGRGPLPHTERAADSSLLVPLFPDMADLEQRQVIDAVRDALPSARHSEFRILNSEFSEVIDA